MQRENKFQASRGGLQKGQMSSHTAAGQLLLAVTLSMQVSRAAVCEPSANVPKKMRSRNNLTLGPSDSE